MRADLQVDWLVLDSDAAGGLVLTQFCRACAPSTGIGEIACTVCGSGPLLAGDIPGQMLDSWLCDRGWQQQELRGEQLQQPALCPRCAPLT